MKKQESHIVNSCRDCPFNDFPRRMKQCKINGIDITDNYKQKTVPLKCKMREVDMLIKLAV